VVNTKDGLLVSNSYKYITAYIMSTDVVTKKPKELNVKYNPGYKKY
jgi:hypothetical protein